MKWADVVSMSAEQVASECSKQIGRTFEYDGLYSYVHGDSVSVRITGVTMNNPFWEVDVNNELLFEDGHVSKRVMDGRQFLAAYAL